MDLRPQAHDIIRTWLFATIVRSHLEFDRLPWSDAAISGWILDPDRKKMSKSKGNVVTPMALLEQYGSDAVRYWAASARPGTDTAFDEGQMRIGRKLAIKILNVSRFVLRVAGDPAQVPAIGPVAALVAVAAGRGSRRRPGSPRAGGAAPRRPRQARAARRGRSGRSRPTHRRGHRGLRAATTTPGPWSEPRPSSGTFCDNYVELVKSRAYGTLGEERAGSARATLRHALSVLLTPVRAVPPLRHRGGLVVVARRTGRSTGPAGQRRRDRRHRRRPRSCWPAASELLGDSSQGQDRGGRVAAGARSRRSGSRRPTTGWRCCRPRRTTCGRPGAIASLRSIQRPTSRAVDVQVELAR